MTCLHRIFHRCRSRRPEEAAIDFRLQVSGFRLPKCLPHDLGGNNVWVLALCLVMGAQASQMVPLTIEQLTHKAQIVVQGIVLGKQCRRDSAGRIYTRLELRVDDVWKGKVPRNPLVVVHGGGKLGRTTAVVTGQVEYEVGEEVVAFVVLNPDGEAVTLGLAQGKFRVWTEPGTGVKVARNRFHGAALDADGAVKNPERAVAERLTVSELKRRVKGAVQ